MSKSYLGFKIEKVLQFQIYKVLNIEPTIPMVRQPYCPSDEVRLKTICTFVGNKGKQKLKVGCCPSCGYVGYIDRPSKDWINNFYLRMWDRAKDRNIVEKSEKLRKNFTSGHIGKKREIIYLAQKLPLDKNRYICEIGSGYGKLLKHMEVLGFKKLIGMESSFHRAEIAQKAYGLRILNASFEDSVVQTELKKLAPFSLIFSHHVLEHSYNPAEIIKLSSALQGNNDYLILSLPNLEEEASMAVLAFLPHLHSFTKKSLEKLLNKNGYVIIDDSLTNKRNLNIVAQKKNSSSIIAKQITENYFDKTVTKIKKGLGLRKFYRASRRRFWWYPKSDIGGQSVFYKTDFLENIHWYLISRINGYKYKKRNVCNSLLISNLDNRYTQEKESPVEIQFNGNIKLFYK